VTTDTALFYVHFSKQLEALGPQAAPYVVATVAEAQNMHPIRRMGTMTGSGVVSKFTLYDKKSASASSSSSSSAMSAQDTPPSISVSTSPTSVLVPSPRFEVSLVDLKRKPREVNCKYAVFIVPQGREHEWMFANDQGLVKLSETANFARLFVVSLVRGQSYIDMISIQNELSPTFASLTVGMMHMNSGDVGGVVHECSQR
jgi:hypothetical protein